VCPQCSVARRRCQAADAVGGLFGGPSDGVDEVVTGRGAHAGEHGLQACGGVGVGVGVVDDLLSVRGEGQLDASAVLWVQRAGTPARSVSTSWLTPTG
jgi:hypothetical protein